MLLLLDRSLPADHVPAEVSAGSAGADLLLSWDAVSTRATSPPACTEDPSRDGPDAVLHRALDSLGLGPVDLDALAGLLPLADLAALDAIAGHARDPRWRHVVVRDWPAGQAGLRLLALPQHARGALGSLLPADRALERALQEDLPADGDPVLHAAGAAQAWLTRVARAFRAPECRLLLAAGELREVALACLWGVDVHRAADRSAVARSWRTEPVAGGYELVVDLPGASGDDVAARRVGDDLVVTVHGSRRRFPLDSVLRRCHVRGGHVREGRLRLRFEPDASQWPPRWLGDGVVARAGGAGR